ncbi:MAG: type II toxin-antitoxin system RelE/ParE family toxin [Pelistega sp.]|nr:type II toxin-antitoxin system RelE/ParE family toxin [Pelistega sp.]
MIVSFKHKGLELFFHTGSKSGIQASHAKKLARILHHLDFAEHISDMDFPAWNLHPLQGTLKNHWSIKVSSNWRLTFIFQNGHAEVVDYQDYH